MGAEVMGQLDLPYGEIAHPFLHPMATSGDWVYLVSTSSRSSREGAFIIVDVSDPTRPELAATIQ